MIYILIVIIIIIGSFYLHQSISLNKISKDLKEVIHGNFNKRLTVYSYNKAITDFVSDINQLLDEFQTIVSMNKNYEEDRKRMIANISHDFRTPLTSMLGYIEMIRKDENIHEEEKRENLYIIENKCQTLRALIEEFFLLSKLDSGDVIVEYNRVDIAEILRQNILLHVKEFEQQHIKPVINIPDKNIYMKGDEKALNRILQNIISNCIKYGGEGEVIGFNLYDNESRITIEIWDRGKGIGSEDIHYIFNRLYTSERSRNKNFQGNGIGLTIVKELVEKLGGDIQVQSEPYKKTAFIIRLPKLKIV
ncbi:sensor histidine kinase [Vallitalea okinawensis]|uniref:sensor histidine kinase n=1 Tax=Vallitalea okinawensis TaxID=2078660 RepID=UPI000CFBCEB0|nr:HAMP domain-containing sensor histidine kinase [Vallitalea okinawensis]